MAKYTMEIRELESTFGRDEVKSWFTQFELSDFLSQEEIEVINARGVWDKDKLAERIVDHYYTREIGTDAIGQFMLFAKERMRELMESYAPLIYSASIRFDPLVNVDYTEEYERTSDSESSSTASSTSNGSSLDVGSDTPQGQISKSRILNGDYASSTSASEAENRVNDTGSSQGKGSEHYLKKTRGNTGISTTSQTLIKQYREIIRALNTEIIYELEPLFMGLY